MPGSTGGSVHVEEVARGLAALGHDVHVVAKPGNGDKGSFTLHPSQTFIDHRVFRFTARRPIAELLERLNVDAVMERYYNFAGEGVRAAHERGMPALLEVNSPLIDHPGSLKAALDRMLLVQPMKRLRDEMCRKATAIVTPLPEIVPEHVPSQKVHRVHWGANVERFRPNVARRALDLPADRPVVAFSGSFRPWHGADVLVRAAARLGDRASFLFIGDGPALSETKALADELGVAKWSVFTGAVPYADMPSTLRCADIGVAPYQPSRLGQMQLGFYWSPLKIFEYMAMGMPVVTLDVPPLRDVIRPGEEGALIAAGDDAALAATLEGWIEEPDKARSMGEAGRRRIVEHFSWQRHCEQLERILQELV